MKQVIDLKINIIKLTALFSAAIVLLTMVIGYGEFAFAFLYGTVIAILSWLLLSKTVEKSVTYSPKKAKIYAVIHYFLRFVLLFLALYIAAHRPDMNVLGAILALFVPKLVIFWKYAIKNSFLKGQSEPLSTYDNHGKHDEHVDYHEKSPHNNDEEEQETETSLSEQVGSRDQ